MTLIIGVRCSDGIVMGADGAATMATIYGQGTITQPVKKLRNISDKIILGVSGSVGLGQILADTIDRMWNDRKFANLNAIQAMRAVRDNIGPIINTEFRYAAEAQKVIGAAVQQSCVVSMLLALPVGGTSHLFTFGPIGEPFESTDDLPFTTIGSGQNLADPFLAFLKSVFWKDRPPNIADGIFATFWSLQHAISRNTGGISDPKQILTLQKDERGNFSVEELTSDKLEEAKEAANAAEDHLGQFDFRQAKTEPPPQPPPVDHREA